MWPPRTFLLLTAAAAAAADDDDDSRAAAANETTSRPVLGAGEDGIRLLRDLAEGMDSSVPPPHLPVNLKLGVYINSFYKVNEQDMDFGISWYLRMAWTDSRLAFTPAEGAKTQLKAPNDYWDKIWTPDVFIRNEKSANIHNHISAHRLMRIKPDGQVWYVVKMSASLSCPMDLHKFPVDVQQCPVMFESFGYTMDTLKFTWLKSPVEMDKSIAMPTFMVEDIVRYDCSQNYTAGAFPCLEVRFVLSRAVGYYAIQVYLPSIVLVIASWMQFYLKPSAVTGRVLVGLFSTFTLTAQLTGIRGTLPKISYMTGIDIWMAVCLLFVFATLLELVAVQLMAQHKGKRSLAVAERTDQDEETPMLDVTARVIFPLVFFIFMIAYWASYTS